MHFRVLDVPAKEVPVGLLLSRVSMQRRARYCFTNVCLSVCLYLRKRMDLIVTVFDDVVATSFYSFFSLTPVTEFRGNSSAGALNIRGGKSFVNVAICLENVTRQAAWSTGRKSGARLIGVGSSDLE